MRILVDGPPASFDRPRGRGVVRLFARHHVSEGIWPTHIATTKLAYVAERSLQAAESQADGAHVAQAAYFDCEYFTYWDDATVVGFCFKYVIIDDVTGKVYDRAKLCLPTHQQRG